MDSSNIDKRLRRLRLSVHGFAATGLVTMVLGVWWSSIRPLESQQYVASQRLARLEETLSAADDIEAEHVSLRKQFAAACEQETSLQARIPDDPSEEEFLALASRLAAETGLQIKDYRPGKSLREPSCSSLEVQLVGKGNYESICGFLDGLSKLPRLSTIASLHIDASKSDADYLVEIAVLLYFGATNQADNSNSKRERDMVRLFTPTREAGVAGAAVSVPALTAKPERQETQPAPSTRRRNPHA